MWGCWDGRHWHDNAPVYAQDWRTKIAGMVYEELVFDRWWTDVETETGADGKLAVRGFRGEYEVSVATPDGPMTKTLSLDGNGGEITLQLE
jgi:hypothetical protein